MQAVKRLFLPGAS